MNKKSASKKMLSQISYWHFYLNDLTYFCSAFRCLLAVDSISFNRFS